MARKNQTTRSISLGEYRKLLNRLNERDALAVRISASTGLRVSDVLGLRVDDIKRKMVVYERKTGKRRIVHLAESTYKAVKDYIERHKKKGRLIDCNRSTVYRNIKKAASDIGLEHVSMHSIRKMYARKYAKKHGLSAAQEELQHKYISTTMMYVFDEKELDNLLK